MAAGAVGHPEGAAGTAPFTASFDLETTGISPAFDHPLQFAAILTDAESREIERVDRHRQLNEAWT